MQPEAEQSSRAMIQACREAGYSEGESVYVNAHGTGTLNNDVTESRALMRVFSGKMPLVSSTKGMTGHTTGPHAHVVTGVIDRRGNNRIGNVKYKVIDPIAWYYKFKPNTP